MIKSVHSPHHQGPVKFGRRPPTQRPKVHLKSYLRALPTPPATSDYSARAGVVLSDVMLNDRLGDCVIAAGYHVVGLETGNAGNTFHATQQQIVADYSAIGGYDPNNSDATDQGCDIPTALRYWQTHGMANGTKIIGAVAIDPADKVEIMLAMYLFENLYFGVALPDQWISPFPSGPGFKWDVAGPADPSNGHAFMGVGHDSIGVHIDSWGMLGVVTYAAIAKYCSAISGGELHALLTPDQLAKGVSKAPNGVDWQAIVSDFNALGGHAPVPVQPPPAPVASKVLTLTQAQTVLAAGWPK